MINRATNRQYQLVRDLAPISVIRYHWTRLVDISNQGLVMIDPIGEVVIDYDHIIYCYYKTLADEYGGAIIR